MHDITVTLDEEGWAWALWAVYRLLDNTSWCGLDDLEIASMENLSADIERQVN
jgi:hypothetical protein